MKIIVEGISEKQIQEGIKRCLAGWKLTLEAPKNANYEFMNPFWGHSWDGSIEQLKHIILTYGKINGIQKHMILVFRYNGEDRFAWCSWEKVLYDFKTQIKHNLVPKYADSMTTLIHKLCSL